VPPWELEALYEDDEQAALWMDRELEIMNLVRDA
jgi:hypothetical protein